VSRLNQAEADRHGWRLTQDAVGWPIWTAGRCPGNGHESVPRIDVTTLRCAVCGRALPNHGSAA